MLRFMIRKKFYYVQTAKVVNSKDVFFKVSALNTIVTTQLSCVKKVVEKFSFSELKIEKVIFFTQSPTNIFCINVFNVGVCLASSLNFRQFLMLDP